MNNSLDNVLFGCDDTRIIEIEPYKGVARFSTVKKMNYYIKKN